MADIHHIKYFKNYFQSKYFREDLITNRTDLGTVLSLITLISFLNNLETVFTMNMLVF
jgi:hypothetical protein